MHFCCLLAHFFGNLVLFNSFDLTLDIPFLKCAFIVMYVPRGWQFNCFLKWSRYNNPLPQIYKTMPNNKVAVATSQFIFFYPKPVKTIALGCYQAYRVFEWVTSLYFSQPSSLMSVLSKALLDSVSGFHFFSSGLFWGFFSLVGFFLIF